MFNCITYQLYFSLGLKPSLKVTRGKFHCILRELRVPIYMWIQVDWDPEASVDKKKIHCNFSSKTLLIQ